MLGSNKTDFIKPILWLSIDTSNNKMASLKQLNKAIRDGHHWAVENLARDLKNNGVDLSMAIATALTYECQNGDNGREVLEILQRIVYEY